MLSLYLALFVTVLAFFVYINRVTLRDRKLPPGPVGLPVLGYLPFLDVFHLGASFKKVGEKFGDVFSLKVGTELAVVLNSYEAIKKAFASDDLTARPNTFMFRYVFTSNLIKNFFREINFTKNFVKLIYLLPKKIQYVVLKIAKRNFM